MNILGISDVTGNHSHSCVGLLQDGQLTFALSQERISRVKNDCRFPADAIKTALDYAGLDIKDINFFACAYPPANYYRSLLQYSKWDAPRSFFGALLRRPISISRYLGPNIRKGLFDPKSRNGLFDMGVPADKFKFFDHHLSHVSAGYFSSGFDKALAFSYGGFAPHRDGRNVAGAVYLCQGDSIEFIDDIPMYASACYYSGVTVALGYTYMEQEGKTMGLAKMGDYHNCYENVRRLTTRFRHGEWRKYANWVDYLMSPRPHVFLGTKSGRQLLKLVKRFGAADVAAAAQRIWEKSIVRFVRHYCELYDVHNLVLTGGAFLNVQINGTLANLDGIQHIFIHPHTGDGSTTIGAMLEAHRELTGQSPRLNLTDMGLGLQYDDKTIEQALQQFAGQLVYERIQDPSLYAAEQLAEEKIIGWFQGREEYGPRSLGHRCLLGHPRNINVKKRMNVDIKNRELWIPVAPSVLAEYGADYFENVPNNPFMTRVYLVKQTKQKEVYAAQHSDGTARVQAVDKQFYPPFRRLLEHFYKLTNIPMVLNTSLNRHGEPIVHQPAEALQMLLKTPMDELVIGSFAVKKAVQK